MKTRPSETPALLADALTVEGVVKVVYHKAGVHDGVTFPAFVEIMVMSARLVR